jgi:hypothetical protein
LSVEPFELLVVVVSVFGLTPFVGPLPASSVDTAPFVGPLPASAFGCATAGADRPRAITEMSKLPRNKNMTASFDRITQLTRYDHREFRIDLPASKSGRCLKTSANPFESRSGLTRNDIGEA